MKVVVCVKQIPDPNTTGQLDPTTHLLKREGVEVVLDPGDEFGVEAGLQLVKAQGGDTSYIDHPEKFPQAKHIRKLPAPKRGYVHTINAAMIARGVHLLGGGKEHPHDKIDYAVGVSEIKKVGTQVKQGEPLMMIHYNDESKLEHALEHFKNAYRLAPKRPTPPPLIVERVA